MGLRKIYEFFVAGLVYQAQWEKEVSRNILNNKLLLWILLLLVLPLLIFQLVFASSDFLGGKYSYGAVHFSPYVFWGATAIGFAAGLITGCIGAGGGFIIAPALMSMGVKGIMAVGTDQFHIFAKAIMGSAIHKKLGNVSFKLAIAFILGSIPGATLGGYINRAIYSKNPIWSDIFISSIYALLLGFLGFYTLYDFYSAKRRSQQMAYDTIAKKTVGMTNFAKRLQSIKFLPPNIKFDYEFGGREISWVFVALGGFIVGLVAALMGVGGGFLAFPIMIYCLGVSTATTVGTDLLQIIFTAGYSSIFQYAIYGYIAYVVEMGLLLGSLIGVQIGALTTKVVPGMTIRGFYAITILSAFVNRITALPDKLRSLGILNWPKELCLWIMHIGNILFWGIVGIFVLWVLYEFFKNIKTLRQEG
ncbi:MAG: sulfite exporter TauE/SafE family protein [Caldimicrobium sp.]|nr:sulfite exporter TauE/SafE family protein [Caldimicrobium sp.]MCX7873968.1 sulfite exporter TauE/SafE family protein [Caldimicrobium sp.]MDW8094193.1 sulfite exporter TauE/SafE family protein [Caldimicrobium sp.]